MNALLQRLVDGELPAAMPAASPLAARPSPIQKLRYSHEAMIDVLIAQPWIKQNELARIFDKSASWISTILCSDLFQSKLAQRRDELVDPEVRFCIKTQMEGLHARSMEILREKLDKDSEQVPDQLALQVLKTTSQGLGMGAPKVSVTETHVHLEELGQNLVGLLRRRRAAVEREIVDGEVTPIEERPRAEAQPLSPPPLKQLQPARGEAPTLQQPELPSPGAGRADDGPPGLPA